MRRLGVLLLAIVVLGGTAWAWRGHSQRVATATDRTPSIERSTSPSVEPVQASVEDERLKVKRPEGQAMRVLFAGDSLTFGLYATRQENGFRSLMVGEWEKGGPVEEFRGEKAGAGAGDVASIIEVPDGLDLAVVELGTNDVGAQTPLDEFEQTYADLLDMIRDGSPGVPLLCVGTWGSDGGGFGSDPYNDVIEETCEDRAGRFVSLYDLYPVEEYRGPAGEQRFGGVSDNFHPNDAGYAAIADLLLDNLTVV